LTRGVFSSLITKTVLDDHDISLNNGGYGALTRDLLLKHATKFWKNNSENSISKTIWTYYHLGVCFIGLDGISFMTDK
jgi:hypothetical protein